MRHFVPTISLFLLAGCATMNHSDRSAPRSDDELIAEAYPYAQLAYNAYHRERSDPPATPFALEPRFVATDIVQDNDNIGLAYEVYRSGSGADERHIFVFRGTEPGACDWRYGNSQREQQRRAADIVKAYRDRLNLRPDQLILVGHSLGAGIATHVSFRQPGSRVYAFNGSPLFRKPKDYRWQDNPTEGRWGHGRWEVEPRRLSIVTRGDFLKLGRIFGREANQVYLPLTCPDGFTVIDKHSMRDLARCLTERAATTNEAGLQEARAAANQSRLRNPALFPPAGTRPPLDTAREALPCDR